MSFNFNSTPFFHEEQKRDIPQKTGDITRVCIIDKLREVGGIVGENLIMGNFDQIGELTARKNRDASHELYKNSGCFFRPNYERGMLMYALVKKYRPSNFLEIGFGRGYVTLCVAMAMQENGVGRITTVDPYFDETHIKRLQQSYPKEWFSRVNFIQATSKEFFASEEVEQKYGVIFIDGDHRYESVKSDWENSKDLFEHVLIFDDYHPPEINEKDIEVANVVDQIDGYEKELVVSDRRIFLDDRKLKHDIDYGMVYLTKR